MQPLFPEEIEIFLTAIFSLNKANKSGTENKKDSAVIVTMCGKKSKRS